MLVFLSCLLVFFFCCLRFNKEKKFLEINSTSSLRGAFVLIILFAHIEVSSTISNPINKQVVSLLAQTTVVPFMLFSGYGLCQKFIQTNKTKSIIISFFKLWIEAIVCLIPYIISSFLLKNPYSPTDFLLSAIFVKDIGERYCWFVFVILFLYLVTYICFKVLGKKRLKIAIWVILFITSIYVVVTNYLKLPTAWFDSILLFPIGMFVSFYKDKLKWFFDKRINSIIMLIISVVLSIGLRYSIWISEIYIMDVALRILLNITFGIFIISFLSIFTIKSRILLFISKSGFTIMLVEAFFITIVFNKFILLYDTYWYYPVVSITSLVVGVGIKHVFNLIEKYTINRLL